MGVFVILFSVLLGASYYLLKFRITLVRLWVFGLVVHLAMLYCILLLPVTMRQLVFSQMLLPLMLLYPLATVLIGRILMDILDHQKMTEGLRHEKEFSKTLIDSLPGIFYLYTYPDNRLILWNKHHETIFGYTAEEMKGRHILSWHVPEAYEKLKEAIDNVMKTGTGSVEAVLMTKDGRRIPFFLTGVRFVSQGQTYMMGTGVDITEQKKAEEVLRQGKEAAEAAIGAKNEFLTNIAHDFRTPMHAIMGFSSFLQSENLTEKQKKFASIINESTRNLLRLVEDLLDVSRLEAGKLELRLVDFDIKECVMAVVKLAGVELLNKEVELRWMIQDNLWRVKGDDVRLNQIITNLLANAIKYTDKGDIVVKVDQDEKDCPKGKCRVRISVKDTGLGIPKERQAQLFDAFARFHEFEGGKQRGGVGLGLYITKTLVDLMQGEINVVSEVGKGSEFVITLEFDRA